MLQQKFTFIGSTRSRQLPSPLSIDRRAYNSGGHEPRSDSVREEAQYVWQLCLSPQERITYIRNNRSYFAFDSYREMIEVVRGRRFSGCAPQLVNWRRRFRAGVWRFAALYCLATWIFIFFALRLLLS
ncbi:MULTISPECIES: hypothetical protein [Bradyrhizobium]|uniref:Uncharacterized protein n=1 Tax=Bradyrhizobium zhengyangense TaxID=2911009 RepID=A0A9X1UC93_9BRAD|nr:MULTISPECIES: hypothetical protein [Bradyrhizobium]MCG2632940.1 hypothetical protein [Bradyrhizobium zhengyangense]MCG2645546.1 hypothetical protein [Bradyrhizobium zhengyangense]MDN5006130.1 hypothetical protein [Bradyrhizobium sp. WYCCWR 12677]